MGDSKIRYKIDHRVDQIQSLFYSLDDNSAKNIAQITGLKIGKVNKMIDLAIYYRTNYKNFEVFDAEIL